MKCDYSALAWVVAYGNLENVEIANLHPRLVNKTVEGHKIRVYHVHLRLQVEHFHFVLIGLDLFNIKLMSIHFCGATLDLLHLKFLNFVRCLGHLAEWLFEMKPTTCHTHWRAHGPKRKGGQKETLNLAHTHFSALFKPSIVCPLRPFDMWRTKALFKDSLKRVGDPWVDIYAHGVETIGILFIFYDHEIITFYYILSSRNDFYGSATN